MKPIEMERLGTMDDPIPIYSLVSSSELGLTLALCARWLSVLA